VLAGLGEVVGCGATCGSGTGDEDVHFANHCCIEFIPARVGTARGLAGAVRGTKIAQGSYPSMQPGNGDAAW
jgi:hypothetical protein